MTSGEAKLLRRGERIAATIAALGGTEENPTEPLPLLLAEAVVPWRQRKAEAEEKRRLRKQRRNPDA